MAKQHGGARPGAGRHASGFTERITLEVTPLMKELIDRYANTVGTSRNEVLRHLLGKQLGVKQNMIWNSQKGAYEGITTQGRKLVVDGDMFAEALQQAERDGANAEEVYDVSVWEHVVGENDSVWYEQRTSPS